MQTVKRHYDPILLALLNMLGIISAVGFLYCIAVLLLGVANANKLDTMMYAIWFAISLQSVISMQRGDLWGAYALGAATIGLTVYDLVNGNASLGGALLGLLVILIVVIYLHAAPLKNSDENKQLEAQH